MRRDCRSFLAPAFTLVEMLVVIAVVAILAALLLPAVAKSKSSAKRTTCQSNLRQVDMAVRMYCDDHSDALPDISTVWWEYKTLLTNYVSVVSSNSIQSVFVCPADVFDVDLATITFTETGSYVNHNGTSYFFAGMNRLDESIPGLAGAKMGDIINPSRTAVVVEASAGAAFSWHASNSSPRYNNAMGVLAFADGHVDYTRIYWNGKFEKLDLPSFYNPIAGYDYKWSPR